MYISWKLDATNIYFSIVKAENLDFEVFLQKLHYLISVYHVSLMNAILYLLLVYSQVV